MATKKTTTKKVQNMENTSSKQASSSGLNEEAIVKSLTEIASFLENYRKKNGTSKHARHERAIRLAAKNIGVRGL